MNMIDELIRIARFKQANSDGTDIKIPLIDESQCTDTVRYETSSSSYAPSINFVDGTAITSNTYVVLVGGTYKISVTPYKYNKSGTSTLKGEVLQEILVDGVVKVSKQTVFKPTSTTTPEIIVSTVDVNPLQTITYRITPVTGISYSFVYLPNSTMYLPTLSAGFETKDMSMHFVKKV